MATNEKNGNGKQNEDEGPRDFSRILMLLDEGVAHCTLSEELQKLTRAVQTQAKARSKKVAGTLSLTLQLACDETGVVSIAYDVARKDPKPKRSQTLLWITKGGNLTEHNPRQQRLPLREVTGGQAAAREIDDAPMAAAQEV